MTDCACNYPVWLYDKNDEEYYALPVNVANDKGIVRRPDLGDFEIVINRDGQDIIFLAMPMKTLNSSSRGRDPEFRIEDIIPESKMVDHEVMLSDGTTIVKQFMKLIWVPTTDEFLKKYDVKGHIFVAGCKPSGLVKEKITDLEGKEVEVLKCSEKGIYSVLHPLDDYLEKHILELESLRQLA